MPISKIGTNGLDQTDLDLGLTGNVGIGTSTPAVKLDVTGTVNSVQSRFGNVAGRGLEIATSLVAGVNDGGSILNAKGATSGTMIFQTDSTERMRITAAGGVAFGGASNFGTSGQVLTSNGDAAPSWQSTSGIGVGQTWQNPSRALNTTYTNSTGKPIEVAFTPTIPSVVVCSGSMVVSGVTVHTWNAYDNASTIPRFGMSMIVPNGATYAINASGSGIQTWAELR